MHSFFKTVTSLFSTKHLSRSYIGKRVLLSLLLPLSSWLLLITFSLLMLLPLLLLLLLLMTLQNTNSEYRKNQHVQQFYEIYYQHCTNVAHPKSIEESIFQLSIDTDKDWFMASDESHASSHKPY